MIKLFAIMQEAGIEVDDSNDNLSETDDGFVWQVPCLSLPSPFPHEALVQSARKHLGDVFRGYTYHVPQNYVFEGTACVELWLSPSYHDEEAQ